MPYEFKTSSKADKVGDAFRKSITWFFDSIQVVVIALAIFVVVYLWILSPHQVRGPSMKPSFFDKELLLADKLTVNMNKLKKGDVIIFQHNETQDHIKRIIGTSGDQVMVRDSKVFLNGEMQSEPYLAELTITYSGAFMSEGMEYTVPEGQLLVMGDNREESYDSRAYGFLDPSEHPIKGRAWVVYWPFENFRVVDRIE